MVNDPIADMLTRVRNAVQARSFRELLETAIKKYTTRAIETAQVIQELIALAKEKPGRLTYGTPGIGTSPHMAMELFKSLAGVDLQHVPYRGTAPAKMASGP